MWRAAYFLAPILVVALLSGCEQAVDSAWFGSYRLADGSLVSLRESVPGTIRLRFYGDGTTRRFEPQNGAWVAGAGISSDRLSNARLRFNASGFTLEDAQGASQATRLELDNRLATIELDVNLHARLTLPAGPGPHPAVVLIHGSGDDAATRTYGTGDFFAANGIAALVYDKRGTGHSGGVYTHDFEQLAQDAVAVVAWLRTQPGINPERIGVTGYSQGGWVGPLTAAKSPHVSYVIANYAMINSPSWEEREETVAAVARRGFDGQALEQVAELSEASIDVMQRGFTGWDAYDAVARKYTEEPWMDALDGTTIGAFERWPHWIVSLIGPYMGPPGLDWNYTSHAALDVLHERGIPIVWQIAAEDRSAPNTETLAEVRRRMRAGETHYLELYPATDHGFMLFRQEADGTRRYGNYHPDYFRTEVHWARTLSQLDPPPEA